jgi:hypothetical protein
MKIQLTEEWWVESDPAGWNLSFQSSEISEKTKKRVSTVETSYHGTLEAAIGWFLNLRLKKTPEQKTLAKQLQSLLDAIQETRDIVVAAMTNTEDSKVAKLPRITQGRARERRAS